MRRTVAVTVTYLLLIFGGISAERANADYTNPVYSGDFPDPHVFLLNTNNAYFAYSTGPLFSGFNAAVVQSSDLTTWSNPVEALPDSGLGSWVNPTTDPVWAPSVMARWYGSTYYVMYYSAPRIVNGVKSYCIGRAQASSPGGPFADGSSAPIACNHPDSVIDASPYILPGATGNNPQAYLTWNGPGKIYSQPLDVGGNMTAGPPTTILTTNPTSSPWERTGTHGTTEGPSVAWDPATQKYKLFYAAGQWRTGGYSTGYATCDSAYGMAVNCTRPASGPWLSSFGQTEGPGGLETFADPAGNLWVVYHAWASGSVGYGKWAPRSLRIDKLCFSGGVPVTNAPSTTPTSFTRSSTCSTDVPVNTGYNWGSAPSGTSEAGTWSKQARHQVNGTSFGGANWQRTFRQDQLRSRYAVQLQAQWVASGTGSAYPKYGIYAVYKDSSNYAVAFLDKNCQCVATSGIVAGQPQPWINWPTGALNFSQPQTLLVKKNNNVLTYYVNNTKIGERNFAISTGQVGLVTEDTKANFSDITITEPGVVSTNPEVLWWPYET